MLTLINRGGCTAYPVFASLPLMIGMHMHLKWNYIFNLKDYDIKSLKKSECQF